ncbi:hypothetical protein P22_2731 [Propionispora sp. 2/2-37]|uniref:hypothetical protein n=1 Tax=Propionispora sp. 2/2-37 TaxID=1677858 RepID=UPI0006C45EF3|nr:hypothetical protein [Propionispora sp. 2/2-37]CUH96641.1 hypothetical protein P22_2731 [Propionispora sp. 2/2-37]
MPGSYYGDECCLNESQVCLRDCFRLLWVQHVYWTRMVIMGIAFDLPDLKQTTNRLLRNAPDFARVFCHFYGNEIASQFECLIREHLVIAAELVKAAKAGKSRAAADAERRWYENAEEIVCFLNDINPNWSVECMRDMWFTHLALTKEEAVATIKKDYDRSIRTFDKIEEEALMMADEFSNGIICQFDL